MSYKDKDWLYDQYWNQKKSLNEIGDICGVNNIKSSSSNAFMANFTFSFSNKVLISIFKIFSLPNFYLNF